MDNNEIDRQIAALQHLRQFNELAGALNRETLCAIKRACDTLLDSVTYKNLGGSNGDLHFLILYGDFLLTCTGLSPVLNLDGVSVITSLRNLTKSERRRFIREKLLEVVRSSSENAFESRGYIAYLLDNNMI